MRFLRKKNPFQLGAGSQGKLSKVDDIDKRQVKS